MWPDQLPHNADKPEDLAARGRVHEVVASVRNLEHLLKSPRIGPKSLTKAVAALHPGVAPIDQALAAVIDELMANHQWLELQALRSWSLERLHAAQKAIAEAAKTKMGAVPRLKLESAVSPVASDLDALRELLTLILACTNAVPSELYVGTLTPQILSSLSPGRFERPRVLKVTPIVTAPSHTLVYADPRAMIHLVGISLGFLADLGACGARLLVSCHEQSAAVLVCCSTDTRPDVLDDWAKAALSDHGSTARPVTCVAKSLAPGAMDIVVHAANHIGVTVTTDANNRLVRLVITPPTAKASRKP